MINIFIAILASLLIYYILFHLWKGWRLDSCRNDLFELRDKLFFYGIDNQILDTPDYRQTEAYVNTAISSAEKLSSSYFITLLIMVEAGKISFQETKYTYVLGKEKREQLLKFKKECLDIVVDYLQSCSMLMIVVSAISFVSYFKKMKNVSTAKKRRKAANSLKRKAFGRAFLCSEESLASELG